MLEPSVSGRDHSRTQRDLQGLLAATSQVEAAAEAVVGHLVAAGFAMPSLYLEQSGRLRCIAFHGYWQVIDGIPPWVGPAGRCFAEERPIWLRGAEGSADFLEVMPGIVAELCVPLAVDGEVIGVLNVKSRVALPDDSLAVVQAAADAFATWLAGVGLPAESPYQRLAWYTTRLAELTTTEDIEHLALSAACELSTMQSALIARRDTNGLAVTAAVGSQAEMLRGLPSSALQTIRSWVEAGISCWTRGDGPVPGSPVNDVLHEAGVAAFVILPLIARAQRIGFLLTADPSPRRPAVDLLGRLELLTVQAASSLQTARAITELRERASRDALTGLGHHASFHTVLRSNTNRAVAVLLIDIDGFKDINDERGHQTGDAVLVEIAGALGQALRDGDRLYRVGGDEFASILTIADPQEAVEVAERLRRAAQATGWATVSIGVACGPPGKALVARADAALYAAKDAGRNAVWLAPDQ